MTPPWLKWSRDIYIEIVPACTGPSAKHEMVSSRSKVLAQDLHENLPRNYTLFLLHIYMLGNSTKWHLNCAPPKDYNIYPSATSNISWEQQTKLYSVIDWEKTEREGQRLLPLCQSSFPYLLPHFHAPSSAWFSGPPNYITQCPHPWQHTTIKTGEAPFYFDWF